jgi:hypothetical protein
MGNSIYIDISHEEKQKIIQDALNNKELSASERIKIMRLI